jgi:FAD/FMN-containing dehydrogenase
MLDADYPKGALNYWKSSVLPELSDRAIDTMIACFAACPPSLSELALEHLHGAVTRVGVADTAFPHRTEGYNFLVLAQWTNKADTDRYIAWARSTYAAMTPFMGANRYVNYLDHDDAGDQVSAAYGSNYHRLQQIKATHDPGNVFHVNQNIRPLG